MPSPPAPHTAAAPAPRRPARPQSAPQGAGGTSQAPSIPPSPSGARVQSRRRPRTAPMSPQVLQQTIQTELGGWVYGV